MTPKSECIQVWPEWSTKTKHGVTLSSGGTGKFFYEVFHPVSGQRVAYGSADSEHGAKTKAGLRFKELV